MSNNVKNVLIGKPQAAGAAFFAVAGTALPTDTSTAKNAAFKSVGYLSDKGITRKINETHTPIKAFGGTIVRKVVSDNDVVYSFEMIETNENSLNAYHSDPNVTVTATTGLTTKTAITIKASNVTRGEWILEYADGLNTIREVIPDGEVTMHGDVVAIDTGAWMYPIEITCYEDSSGVKAYQYIDNGIVNP